MTIFIPYNSAGSSGPAIFVAALSVYFKSRGYKVTHRFSPSFDILIVIAECSLFLSLYAKLTGKRIVQRLDGVYHPGLPGATKYTYPLKNLRMQIIHNYLADHVIYQSQFAKHSCQILLGKRAKTTSIIYNGVAVAFSNSNAETTGGAVERLPARGTLSTKCDCGRRAGMVPRRQDLSPLLQLTTFASFRRLDQIKPILESVKHLTTPYHLHIYGPHTNNLSQLFSSLKNNSNVTYNGPKSHQELLARLPKHDIFLFSDQSACPNAVLEALAAGLPVVAFNRGSIPELIEPGLSGEVVGLPPHDPFRDPYPFTQQSLHQFSQAITTMANNLPHYKTGARQHAKRKYNITNTFKQYEKILT